MILDQISTTFLRDLREVENFFSNYLSGKENNTRLPRNVHLPFLFTQRVDSLQISRSVLISHSGMMELPKQENGFATWLIRSNFEAHVSA